MPADVWASPRLSRMPWQLQWQGPAAHGWLREPLAIGQLWQQQSRKGQVAAALWVKQISWWEVASTSKGKAAAHCLPAQSKGIGRLRNWLWQKHGERMLVWQACSAATALNMSCVWPMATCERTYGFEIPRLPSLGCTVVACAAWTGYPISTITNCVILSDVLSS